MGEMIWVFKKKAYMKIYKISFIVCWLCITISACNKANLPMSLSFISKDDKGYEEIYLIDTSKNIKNLSSDSTDKCCLTWSSKANRLAFASFASEEAYTTTSLNTLDIDTLLVNTIFTWKGQIFGLDWSPDGDQLVFSASLEGYPPSIYIINFDGSDMFQVTNVSPEDPKSIGTDYSPVWSPDGTQIAFSSNKSLGANTVEYYDLSILSIDLETRDLVQLTFDPGIENSPEWSPDGKYLAYSSKTEDGKAALCIIDLDNLISKKLLESDNFFGTPSWSPDGTYLVLTEYSTFDCETQDCVLSTMVFIVDQSFSYKIDSLENAESPVWIP
jgi:Tol biopolymer transport system component